MFCQIFVIEAYPFFHYNIDMTENEAIKILAAPILKKLKELEDEMGDQEMVEIPSIHFIRSQIPDHIKIDGIEIDDALLDKLEAYVQEQIEAEHRPTVLH